MIVHYFDFRRAGCVLWPLEANQSRIIKFLDQTRVGDGSTGGVGKPAPGPRQPRGFFGSVEIDLDRPVKSFDAILNAVVMELQRTQRAKVKLTLEIAAEAPAGFAEGDIRVVRDNARQLEFKPESTGFED